MHPTPIVPALHHVNGVFFHQLREPLRSLASVSHLLAGHARSREDTDAVTYSALISSAAHRMHHILATVQQYLNIQRTEGEVQEIDMWEVAHEAKQDLASMLLERDILVQVESLPILQGQYTGFMRMVSEMLKVVSLHGSLKGRPIYVRGAHQEKRAQIKLVFHETERLRQFCAQSFDLAQAFDAGEDADLTRDLVLLNRLAEVHGGRLFVEALDEEEVALGVEFISL